LIEGDGSFTYNINELETAARYKIEVVMLVFNNATLFFDRTVAFELAEEFGEEIVRNSYDFTDIQFGKLADALGCYGVRVERPDELHDAIEGALAARGPAVIDIPTKVMPKTAVEKMYAV
jgi:acetolactate synthase-1/2/3 large subunit